MRETTRRALLAAVLGGGIGAAGLSSIGDRLSSFAPLSGRAWAESQRGVPETVASTYGDATVTYDDDHVPHVEADDERAAYFAVGYVHAADRLFEMDLIRRRMDGRLSAAFGERTVESDRFHAKMDFRGAAAASAQALAGTRTETLMEAYADGVNAYLDSGPDPLEFGLVGYDAGEWSVLDTLLVGAQVSWGLTGSFETLRRALLREKLGASTVRRLYDRRFDHGAPIIRERTGGTIEGTGAASDALRDLSPSFVDWLARFEPPSVRGSSHWAVHGDHTESGSPLLAYDPHLTLMAPPVWYEQHVTVGDVDVRGATFPGIPFVVVGETAHGAWGFTNTGADVVDFYTYETDGDQYRYRDGWREFETERRTIAVAGGDDRTVTVRKTVHGPFLDREVGGETHHVGVAWTGTSGTRESQAIYEFSHATGLDDYRAALRKMDVPTQNALFVDDETVYYKVAGKIPVRRVDGEVVRGDRVFDGSAAEAEWTGFEPFGESSWDGFVPFEDKPGLVNPDYVGTANQRPVDDPTYPIGQEYASGFRAVRIYERLDDRVGGSEAGERSGDGGDGDQTGGGEEGDGAKNGQPVDRAFMASLQLDTLDVRARMLVPELLAVRDRLPDAADPWLDALEEWDYRMTRDSKAALAFDRFYDAFRDATWKPLLEPHGLGESWYPREWVLVTLPADDPVFEGDRAAVVADAMRTAVERLERGDAAVYGDVNRTTIDHPFGDQVPALNYPRYPTDGSGFTLFNVREDADAGSSWRQVSAMVDESLSVLPGGQDGSYTSDHYADQLRAWADGEYKPMSFDVPDDGQRIRFQGDDG